MPEDARYCFAWFAEEPLRKDGDRAALWRLAKWPPNAVITVSFLGGDEVVQQRVKAAARLWTAPGLARLTLEFRSDTDDTDLRIAFQAGNGSWSSIGTTCKRVKKDRPTMNFGWLTRDSSERDIRAVVLHEFGHALGLIHEHQNPAGGIPWNKDVIYRELGGAPNHWDRATIDYNMFQPWVAAETNFTKVDPQSIMMYPIPARWTTNGFTVGANVELSEGDKQLIAQQYP